MKKLGCNKLERKYKFLITRKKILKNFLIQNNKTKIMSNIRDLEKQLQVCVFENVFDLCVQ